MDLRYDARNVDLLDECQNIELARDFRHFIRSDSEGYLRQIPMITAMPYKIANLNFRTFPRLLFVILSIFLAPKTGASDNFLEKMFEPEDCKQSASEAPKLACEIYGAGSAEYLRLHSIQLKHASQDMIFQEIAQRSDESTQCQLNFLKEYSHFGPSHDQLNSEAYKAFLEQQKSIQKLNSEYADLSQELGALKQGSTPAEHDATQAANYAAQARVQEKMGLNNLVYRGIAVNIPMGDRPEIASFLREMANKPLLDPAHDKERFAEAFSDAMNRYTQKMQDSADHYARIKKNGFYDLKNKDKEDAVKIGQTELFLASIDPYGHLSSKVQSCLVTKYVTDPQARRALTTGAMLIIPGVGEVGGYLMATKRLAGLSEAAQAAAMVGINIARTLGVVGSFYGAGTAVYDAVYACYGDTYLVDPKKSTCDPKAQLQAVLNEPTVGACVTASLAAVPAMANYKSFLLATKVTGKMVSRILGDEERARILVQNSTLIENYNSNASTNWEVYAKVDPKPQFVKEGDLPKLAYDRISSVRTNFSSQYMKFDRPEFRRVSMNSSALPGERLASILPKDPVLSQKLLNVFDKLHNPKAFADYMEILMRDTFKKMLSSGNAHLQELARDGKISGDMVMEVIKERMRTRQIPVVKLSSFEKPHQNAFRGVVSDHNFQKALKSGVIIDDVLSGGLEVEHGINTHALQMDYVLSEVKSSVPVGTPDIESFARYKDFFNYLGTNQGLKYWSDTFDHFDESRSLSDTTFIKQHFMNPLALDLK